jgi:hypothetical protein
MKITMILFFGVMSYTTMGQWVDGVKLDTLSVPYLIAREGNKDFSSKKMYNIDYGQANDKSSNYRLSGEDGKVLYFNSEVSLFLLLHSLGFEYIDKWTDKTPMNTTYDAYLFRKIGK